MNKIILRYAKVIGTAGQSVSFNFPRPHLIIAILNPNGTVNYFPYDKGNPLEHFMQLDFASANFEYSFELARYADLRCFNEAGNRVITNATANPIVNGDKYNLWYLELIEG